MALKDTRDKQVFSKENSLNISHKLHECVGIGDAGSRPDAPAEQDWAPDGQGDSDTPADGTEQIGDSSSDESAGSNPDGTSGALLLPWICTS